MEPSALEKFNDFFYRKSLSLFDWLLMLMICNLIAEHSFWWVLVLYPAMIVGKKLSDRFTLD